MQLLERTGEAALAGFQVYHQIHIKAFPHAKIKLYQNVTLLDRSP